MLPSIKELLGLSEGPLTTCFYLKDTAGVGYGSPVFTPAALLTKKQEDNQINDSVEMFRKGMPRSKSSSNRPVLIKATNTMQALVISPWMYNNLCTAGGGKSFFNQLLVSQKTTKVWEKDSILNHVKLAEIDSMADLSIFETKNSFATAVFDNGFVFVTPNNMKTTEHMCLYLKTLAANYRFSLLHSNNFNVAVDPSPPNRMHFFSSRFAMSPEAMFLPVMFGIDMKYCIPFYDSRSQNGIFVGMLLFTLYQNSERLMFDRVATFSFFLSDYEEGLYSIDCQRVLERCPVTASNFNELITRVANTSPFKPSILLPKKNGAKTIKQKRDKNRLETRKDAEPIIAPEKAHMWIEASSSSTTMTYDNTIGDYGRYYATNPAEPANEQFDVKETQRRAMKRVAIKNPFMVHENAAIEEIVEERPIKQKKRVRVKVGPLTPSAKKRLIDDAQRIAKKFGNSFEIDYAEELAAESTTAPPDTSPKAPRVASRSKPKKRPEKNFDQYVKRYIKSGVNDTTT